jgi:methylglutaconyl-CoA hydratase
VVAVSFARFGYPEVRVGFVPAMVMALLRRQIGEKRAFELVATGRQVTAREALELGLVSRVVPHDEFEGAVDQLAKELAAMPPEALRQTKRLFYALDDVGFSDGIAQAVRVNVEARSTKEFRDGVRRFAPRPERS